MTDLAIDREARSRLDRVEVNQRELEHALALLQRDQAVTAEVLRGVVEAQKRLFDQFGTQDKAVHDLEAVAAAAKVRWAMIGSVAMLALAVLVNKLGLL